MLKETPSLGIILTKKKLIILVNQKMEDVKKLQIVFSNEMPGLNLVLSIILKYY